jgi:hypothetical protein
MLQKLPQLVETKLVGIADYGFCEIKGNKATHFRFFVPPCTSATAITPTSCAAERSFAYALIGTDSWIPEHMQFVDVNRATTSFEGGWEYRVECTNGTTSEHWWVPPDKVKAFELFLKDNSS